MTIPWRAVRRRRWCPRREEGGGDGGGGGGGGGGRSIGGVEGLHKTLCKTNERVRG